MITLEQLKLVARLADFGLAEAPWAWSEDITETSEECEKAVSDFSDYIESLKSET
jgi:hypothetical protein